MSLFCKSVSILALSGTSLLAIMAAPVFAQATSSLPGNVVLLERLEISGSSTEEAPTTGTIGQPPAAAPGGQVATGARLGTLGNRSVLETPFTITGYTEKLIRDQQARTIADIALNDPSVRNDASTFSERDAFIMRGFLVTNLDTAYDGLFYLANPRRSFLEGIERVEILKGPTAFVNGGVGRVGGTINLVPKRATDAPITRLTTTYASDAQLGTHIDFGRRFGENNELGIRINGSYRNGDTAYDHNQAEVGVASIALDYRGERLRASLDYNHSTQNLDAPTSLFNSIATGVAVPPAPNGRTNTASPFEYHDSTYNMLAGRVEFDVLPNTTIYAAGGMSRYNEDFLTSSYRVTNANGNAIGTLEIQPQKIQGLSGEIGVRSEFDTGPVGHQVSISASRAINQNYRGGFLPASYGLPISYPTNIYNPSYLADGSVNIAALPTSDNLPLLAELTATSLAFSDTLSVLDDRFQLTLGGRYQHITSLGFNTRPGATPIGLQTYTYEEGRFSPAIAAMARVTDSISIYGNYVEALTEGPIAPATATNGGEIFAPVVNTQREIGVKYDGETFGLAAALFQIEEPSGFTAPGGAYSLDGLQVNRGLELSAYGEPFEGFRLLGAVTFMDATIENSAGGTLDGKKARGVPDVAFSLYGEYDLTAITPGLSVNGRLIYSGSTFYNSANTQEVSDWARVDVGVRYEFEGAFGKPVELRANVENLFDEAYWASSARGYIAAGAPRTFKVSASFEF